SRAESVSIYDLNGKMLLSNSVSSEGIVSTAQLPKGIYIIRLTDENGNVFSKKLRKP
ncbi:MAG: T9SS type A sorting domain-containing protein, partial [Flavobacteriaceae bacterium]|nr:T9SS type A sorting domain-containing protein [Flavobacteriaceae bacterium]